jgi:hypothetical protein
MAILAFGPSYMCWCLMQLQQDADFNHWGVDFSALQHRAQELDIQLIRRPVSIASLFIDKEQSAVATYKCASNSKIHQAHWFAACLL